MQSTSEPSTKSPINIIPNDVLTEIFAHCLPRFPLKEQQPNTAIAPMLLCRICSSWRTIALATLTLWSHLSFCLTFLGDSSFRALPLAFVESEIEFIRWWRKNQGSMAPFLSFSIKHNPRETSQQPKGEMAGIMEFLVEYMVSAEYLQLHHFFWARIRERLALVKFGSLESSIFYDAEALKSPDGFPALRRLSISGGVLARFKHSSHIPLTHISLHHISLPLSFWFSLIRALPNLQCGYFDIKDIHDHERYAEPPMCIPPQLSTFCMAFRNARGYSAEFSFRRLFTNLHLSSVRTLELSWPHGEESRWYESYHDNSTASLYAAFKSTPAVTTLVLGEAFLYLFSAEPSQVGLTVAGRVEPIWHHVPNLVELQLQVPHGGYREQSERTKEEVKAAVDGFVRDTLFAEGNWLDLGNPACPIRIVTIIDGVPPARDFDIFSSSNRVPESIAEFAMSKIRMQADRVANVLFQSASKSATYLAIDALSD